MDIEKIEGIVAKLAKNGDRDTLILVSDLLSEISKFKKKGEKSSLREMVETVKEDVGISNHASYILDGIPDRPANIPTNNNVGNVNTGMSDMASHASMLF